MIERIENERGSILIEALVSAVILVITAVGVFSAFEAGTRASAEERHRAQAEGLAQADIARLRTMRISALVNLHETKSVTVEKTPYTVDSVATFQTDENGTASCKDGEASADYVEIRSTVSWPTLGSRKPVVQSSLVAPPNGSVSADSGTLAVQIENAELGGVPNVWLSGTGDGTFSGVTGENGCAIFGDLPAGNYTLTLSGGSLVEKNGNPPEPIATSVVKESTNTLVLQYDFGGSIEADFETTVDEELIPSSAASIVAYNSGMLLPKVFGAPGEPQMEVTATPLFPFASAYSVYAGSCKKDAPPVGVPEGTVGEAIVSPKEASPVTILLPPLHLTVWSGVDETNQGEPIEGARVTVTDAECIAEDEETGIGDPTQTYTTDAEGHLPDPGLPFSSYDVCASAGGTHVEQGGVPVPEPHGVEEEVEEEPEAEEEEAPVNEYEEPQRGTTLNLYLQSAEAESGECP